MISTGSLKRLPAIAALSLVFLAGSAFGAGTTGATNCPPCPPTAPDLIATAKAAGKFSTFLKLVAAAGLTHELETGQYTVFAPTNDAFKKLPAGTVENWLKPANRAQLQSIVKYHIVTQVLPSSAFAQTASPTHNANTLDGRQLTFQSDNTGVTVNGVRVEEVDIKAGNGYIHAIDTVLTPPSR